MQLRWHVVFAVFKRNFTSYFSGVVGYLFIVVFVGLGSFMAFRDQFFANNLANLAQLNQLFPLLLLFIVPAITMNVWAEEKKMGTDEILFTLPATDGEIVLGKYLSVLAVYSVAILFSLSHIVNLIRLGAPDFGLLLSNYLGYWLAGASLLTAGMLASILTSSTPVAFVLGALICAVPVFLGDVLPYVRLFQALTLREQFRDFGLGMIPFAGVLYFISLAILMLYLNMVLVSKRHWKTGTKGGLGLQYLVRGSCLAVVLVSGNVVLANWNTRVDITYERLYTISDATEEVLDSVETPVLVQAFLSPEQEVPREYASMRSTLEGLLRQFDQVGGENVQVRITETEQFSDQADEASRYGITSREVFSERAGRSSSVEVFMGVVITGGIDDEVVIPFFDVGTPVEYELTRSVRTVAQKKRRKVGVLTTDARLTGGFNMQMMSSEPEWRFIQELKKQYDVQQVSADSPISGNFSVLIAAMPSSLTQPQLDNFASYIKAGNPVLILDDPLPAFNLGLAPHLEKPRQGGGGMMGMGGPPPQPKGNFSRLIAELGLNWNIRGTVFDLYNPHTQYRDVMQPELVFVGQASGADEPFNLDSEVTSGLQEVLLLFPGTISSSSADDDMQVRALLKCSEQSGVLDWSDITTPGIFGRYGINPRPMRVRDPREHTLAAHITGKVRSLTPPLGAEANENQPESSEEVNVVFVADLDFVSDMFFQIRDRQLYGLNLDNITFVLNAVDVLAGDEMLVPLRKRRAQHRTLTRVENETKKYIDEQTKEAEKADEEAKERLREAQDRLDAAVEKIRQDTSLDERTKRIRIEMVRENEQRKLDVEEARIEKDKQTRIKQSKNQTQRQIRIIERQHKWTSILIPPIPPLLLGLLIFGKRVSDESRNIVPERIARDVR